MNDEHVQSGRAFTLDPYTCKRHGWWGSRPGSSTWTEARISREGGGAQHRCPDCGLWVYCNDWPKCPGPEAEISIYSKKTTRHAQP